MTFFRQCISTLLLVLMAAPALADVLGAELAKQVTIRRTEYGVPHILADNERAAGFGMGYVQAEDHAENIMRSIIRARGRLAEQFGSKRDVESDFTNRQYRVYARAIETYHLLDQDWRDMLEGFAAGFTYYVELHKADLPDWVGPVNGHDIAAHGLTGVARFAFDRGRIVSRFIKRLEDGEEAVVDPNEEDLMGSNFWAFAPSRTKSGNAILMGNPHQGWSEVATYYEAHITVPGKYNFYGTTFVGRPVLTTGFNDHLGWTHTVNYPDLEEIYALDRDPSNEGHYLFDGGSVPIRTESHTINIKTDSGLETETREFKHTPLGPVIHETDDQIFVLRSAAYDEFRFYQQWYRLGQANSWSEFQEALEIQSIPMFNVAYADDAGNIYYLWNGTIPDLPHAAHRDQAVHARGSADIWTNFHPLSELPQWLNPEGGYIMNSNSPPYFTNLNSPAKREDFPAHFPDNRLSLRSQHSLHLIHNDDKYSLEDVAKMKFAMGMLLADRMKDDLLAAVLQSNPDDATREAVRTLYNWDNTVTRDSRGSLLFKTWWGIYSKGRTAETTYAVQWSEDNPIETPRGVADFKHAAESFTAAMADLEERYGSWDLPWGEVHRVRRGELDVPVGGGGGALGSFRVLSFRKDDDGKFYVAGGDSGIMAVEFGETPKAYTVVGYSQSSHADSPHHTDQSILYADNRMKRAAFTEEEIEDQLLETYHPGQERASKGDLVSRKQ